MCNRMPCGKSIGGGGVSSMVCAPCGEETMETIEEIDPWSSSVSRLNNLFVPSCLHCLI